MGASNIGVGIAAFDATRSQDLQIGGFQTGSGQVQGAAVAGAALQHQPVAYRQALQQAADAVINQYTKDGVTDVQALQKNAVGAQRTAEQADTTLATKLNDPTLSLETKRSLVQQDERLHLNANIAGVAANKAAHFDHEVDGVINQFSKGKPLTLDTLQSILDHGKTVHAAATETIAANSKILHDPNASPAQKLAAYNASKKASHAEDVAVAAVGKAQQTYIAANGEQMQAAA